MEGWNEYTRFLIALFIILNSFVATAVELIANNFKQLFPVFARVCLGFKLTPAGAAFFVQQGVASAV